MEETWVVYILHCHDGSLYTGVTNDLEKRLKQHNLGKGAKYTATRTPVRLVYREKVLDRSTALKREYQLKQLTRIQKLELIKTFAREAHIGEGLSLWWAKRVKCFKLL